MKITGYHIDPTKQTITLVEVDQHKLDDIYKIIHDSIFDTTRLNSGDMVYVDDEGLLNGAAQTHGMFIIKGDDKLFPRPLAGHGLVLGVDPLGNSVDAKITLDDLTDLIEFAHPRDIYRRAQAREFG